LQCVSNIFAALQGKMLDTTSLLSAKNMHKRSVNDCKSCESGTYRAMWSLLDIITVLAAIIGQRECDTLPAWSWKRVSTECQQFLVLHHGESKHDGAITVHVRCCELVFMLNGSQTLSCSFQTESSCDCPGGCCMNISGLSAYKGCQLLVYRCLQSSTT